MPFIEGIPTVVVHLDKPRALGFTMGAMRRIKDALGTLEVGSLKGPEAVFKVPACIWACLDDEGRAEISQPQLEEMIHPGNLGAITDAIVKLFEQSNPEAAAGATADPTGPRLASTG